MTVLKNLESRTTKILMRKGIEDKVIILINLTKTNKIMRIKLLLIRLKERQTIIWTKLQVHKSFLKKILAIVVCLTISLNSNKLSLNMLILGKGWILLQVNLVINRIIIIQVLESLLTNLNSKMDLSIIMVRASWLERNLMTRWFKSSRAKLGLLENLMIF